MIGWDIAAGAGAQALEGSLLMPLSLRRSLPYGAGICWLLWSLLSLLLWDSIPRPSSRPFLIRLWWTEALPPSPLTAWTSQLQLPVSTPLRFRLRLSPDLSLRGLHPDPQCSSLLEPPTAAQRCQGVLLLFVQLIFPKILPHPGCLADRPPKVQPEGYFLHEAF